MYPLAHLIYGVPLTQALADEIQRMEDDPHSEWSEDGQTTCGFTLIYSGVAERLVGYCGVHLTEFACVQEPITLTSLPTASPDQQARAHAALAALPAGLRALCPPLGHHLVFGTS